MRRMVIPLVLAAALAACAALGPRLASPEVVGANVRVIRVALPEVTLAIDLELSNPNAVEVVVLGFVAWWPIGLAILRSRASIPSAQSRTNENSYTAIATPSPIQPGQATRSAHAAAATSADRKVIWLGVIGVPRSAYTTTAAGGRAIRRVNQLTSLRLSDAR